MVVKYICTCAHYFPLNKWFIACDWNFTDKEERLLMFSHKLEVNLPLLVWVTIISHLRCVHPPLAFGFIEQFSSMNFDNADAMLASLSLPCVWYYDYRLYITW